MQHDENVLILGLDLIRCGYDEGTDKVIAIAGALYERGWRLDPAPSVALDAVYPERAPEQAIPALSVDPDADVENPAGDLRRASRPLKTSTVRTGQGGNSVKWGTDWTDANNIVPPVGWQQKKWSGWSLNSHQTNVMRLYSGERGRVTATLAYIDKHAADPGRAPDAKWHKPRFAISSLIRRGLLVEVKTDVFTITPRGKLFLINHLGVAPAPKVDDVTAVAVA